MSQNAVNFSAA